MSNWRPIETVDLTIESVDLFGYIDYDLIEMRLTDCEMINGEWHYFCGGEMLHIDGIGYHPTHWMPLPENP